MAVEKDMQTALNRAVDSCIEKGILKEFLLKNRAEVLGILLTEARRSNEFLKSLPDRELQKKLFVEFGLEEGK